MQKKVLVIGVTIFGATVLLAAGYWLTNNDKPIVPTASNTATAETIITTVEPATIVVTEKDSAPQPEPDQLISPAPPLRSIIAASPKLQNSDPRVLLAIADISPKLSQWLLPAEQIRKWVLAIDLMADGKLPKRYRPVDYPMPSFAVQTEGTQNNSAATNNPRMNPIIDTIITIDPKLLVRYYRAWQPLLEAAHQEQGKNGSFDQRLRQCISQVLAVDPLQEPAALTRTSVLYRYADQQLEAANDVDKLLWRMGDNNAENIQGFLRELRYELDG